MFFNFKITKKGLKFMDKTMAQVLRENVISIPLSQIKELKREVITNIKKLEDELNWVMISYWI